MRKRDLGAPKRRTGTHRGRVTVVEAKLYSRPSLSIPLFGAAVTPQTAAFVGGWGDGLLTTGNSVEELERIIDAFRANGGQGKPVQVQLALSWAQTEDEAHAQALDQWAPVAIGGEVNWDLRQRISTGPDAWSGDPRSTNAYWSVLTRVRISSELPASAARDFIQPILALPSGHCIDQRISEYCTALCHHESMAVGKSAVTKALVQRFEKYAHLRGDAFLRMIARGGSVVGPVSSEAITQLHLRQDIAMDAVRRFV